jgi:hypothetical protein
VLEQRPGLSRLPLILLRIAPGALVSMLDRILK